jgi:putative membrane protein
MTTDVQRAALPEDHPHEAVRDIDWGQAARIVASGACMGTADLVPGVSGGTMAVALGIYRNFLGAIDSVTNAVRAVPQMGVVPAAGTVHWRFIAMLGLGMLCALVIMGKIVGLPEMVNTNPKPVYAVFFGLVLASTVVLMRRIEGWSPGAFLSLPVGAFFGYLVVQLVPMQTPEHPLFVFLCGVIAITAMVLPGISGSFMLLVLGKYEYVMTSLLSLRLSVVVPFALGCLLGITSFSKLLGFLLDRYTNIMMAGLTGLLLGTLVRIWPYQHVRMEVIRDKPRVVESVAFLPDAFEWWVPALAVAGFLLVIGIELAAAGRKGKLSS